MSLEIGIKSFEAMKQISRLLSLAAVAAVCFSACSPEELKNNNVDVKKYVTVHFGTENTDPTSTKATLTPNEGETAFQAKWENEDKIAIKYTYVDDGYSNTVPGTWDKSSSKFTAEIEDFTSEGEVLKMNYQASYPYSEDGYVDFGSARTQTGAAYNSVYDLMVAEPVTVTAKPGLDKDGNAIVFPMQRQTAIAYFHFTSNNTEAITKATLKVEGEGAAIAAKTVLMDPTGMDYETGLSEIVLTTTGQTADNFTLWFNVLPTTYTKMTLTVETATKTFTISNTKGGSYTAGKLYKVKKENITWTGEGGSDTPSTVTDVITSDKLAATTTGYVNFSNKSFTSTAVYAGNSAVSTSGHIQLRSSNSNSGVVTTATGGKVKKITIVWSKDNSQDRTLDIYGKNTPYESAENLYASTNAAQGTKLGSLNSTNKDTELTITGDYSYIGLRSNNNALQLESISIEWEPGSSEPAPDTYSVSCATVTGGTLSASPVKAEAGAEVTLTATPSSSAYEFDGNWTVTAADGSPVTVSGTGTTATFVMPAQNVSVTGSFSAKAEPLATFDQIFALASEYGTTKGDASIKFNNWVVSGVKNSNVYLTDGQKGCIIYTSDHGFEKGDILSGTVACKLMLYKGSAEIVDLTSTTEGLTVNKGGALTPVSIPISNLSGVNTGALLSFSGLTYNGSVFSDGTNTITPYNTFITLPSLKTGNKYNVTGVYIQYNSTKEISPLSADDIQEQEVTKYAITIDSNIQNGTVSASVDSASEGAVITLTATANTGYKFDNWNVMDAEGNAISVTSNKFTMPASAVTVSANFVEGKEEQKFSKTYAYGSFETGWSLTNYSDKSSYYLVPSGDNSPSVATISGIFTNKTIQSDVVITLNVATYGNGTDPSASTFSIYADSDCTKSVTATQSGKLPTSKTYTDAVYTVTKENATALISDLAIKITKPGKQIRLKSIKIEFSYSE